MFGFKVVDIEDVLAGRYSAEEYHNFVIVVTDVKIPWEYESLKFKADWSVKQCQEFLLLTLLTCIISGSIVYVFTEDNYQKFREYIEKSKKAWSLLEEAKEIFAELGVSIIVADKNSTDMKDKDIQESKDSSEPPTPYRFNFNSN